MPSSITLFSQSVGSNQKEKMVSIVKKIHFGLLLFLAFNILIQLIFSLELDARFIFILKIFTYISGLALLIFTI